LNVAVMVTVAIVRVVQVAIDEVVGVIPVRNCFVAAAGPVLMLRVVARAFMTGGAIGWIACGDAQFVLVNVIAVHVVQVPIVQVVDVIRVLNGRVAATRTMLVRMIVVDKVFLSHNSSWGAA
jgi:hypothetical protein